MSTNDPDFFQAPKYTPESFQPPKQRGCFFYGCIIASVLAVLMVAFVGVVGVIGYRFARQVIEDYTSTQPRELPKVEISDEARKAVKVRFDEFRAAVRSGTPTEPLVLSSDDLNALIEQDPDLKGKIFVKIEDDIVKGQISIPLESIGLPLFKGRYLNGEADIKASLISGVLIVTLDSIEVNGKRPPEQMLQELRRQNLVQDITKDADNAEMIRKLDSIQIKDGKIIVTARAKTPKNEAEKKETPAAKDTSKANDAPAAKKASPAGEPASAKQTPATANDAPKNGAPAQIKIEPPAAAPKP